jgi:hypothetical protein
MFSFSIINDLSFVLTLNWIDFNGKIIEWTTIEPDENKETNSVLNHLWYLTSTSKIIDLDFRLGKDYPFLITNVVVKASQLLNKGL